MTDDEAVLICSRGPNIVEGSTPDLCSNCGTDVFVSPSGRDIAAGQGAIILCVECGLTRASNDPNAEIQAPTPEQLAEIRAYARDTARNQ